MTPPGVALVTGGGRGIGRAIALDLADRGHPVALLARTTGQLEQVVRQIADGGGRAIALSADVTDPAAIAAAVAECQRRVGAPSVLVNNAGIAPSVRFLDTDLETWERVLRVNATGAFLCTRACLPAMLEAGFGRIVNVASTAGKWGYPYTVAYTASKHALIGLTRALAIELARKGVTVNAVCPGFTRTDIVATASDNISTRTGRTREEAEAELARMQPIGRLIEPEEVARVVAFLASAEAAAITGQTWNIDGGAVQS